MTPAQKIYQKLCEENAIGTEGKIFFKSKDINFEVKDISVVGNVIQEWLGHFMLKHKIKFCKSENTQEFPDFFMSNTQDKTKLLEVKSFTKSPNFDIANFAAYVRSMRTQAYRLDADYLIFKYAVADSGIVIKEIWLKKVWEICSGSERSPVKIQWKQNNPVNIRPCTWYGSGEYLPFDSRRAFVEALDEVIRGSSVESSIQKDWLKVVKQNYHETKNKDL